MQGKIKKPKAMKTGHRFYSLLFLLSLALAACVSNSTEPATEPAELPTQTSTASATLSAEPIKRPTATRAATLTPTITTEQLELEILESEVWKDSYGNTRARAVVRNPYGFSVEMAFRPRVNLYDKDGKVLRSQELLVDGNYGTITFSPGQSHTFVGCFDPCDGGVPVGDWKTFGFTFIVRREG